MSSWPNPSNTCGLLILVGITIAAAVAEANRQLVAPPASCTDRMANYSCQADTVASTCARASFGVLGGQVLRSWWVDPAIATLGFASAIAFFDHRERQEGCGKRETGGVSRWSLISYWLFVYLWVSIVPAPASARIPDGWPQMSSLQGWARDSLYLMLEVAYGVWAYDFLFFFLHWAMHACKLQAHFFHHNRGQSHISDEVSKTVGGESSVARKAAEIAEIKAYAAAWQLRARDVLTHAPLDGFLQVVTNILVQRSLPWCVCKSRTARAMHNILVTWMLTESHTAAKEPRLFRRVCAGVRRHRSHHENGDDTYQQIFCYLDAARSALTSRAATDATDGTARTWAVRHALASGEHVAPPSLELPSAPARVSPPALDKAVAPPEGEQGAG